MHDLSPAYLSALAIQIGSMSAFLGGFAATFLGTLLAVRAKGRIATVAIAFAAVSSVALIVAVLGSTGVFAALHPDGPGGSEAMAQVQWERSTMALSFILGVVSLLVSLGLSGWLRSRAAGLSTSIAAGVGVMFILAMVGVGG